MENFMQLQNALIMSPKSGFSFVFMQAAPGTPTQYALREEHISVSVLQK